MSGSNDTTIAINPSVFGESFSDICNKLQQKIYTFGTKRKGRSPAWEVFREILKNENEVIMGVLGCNVCFKVVKFQSGSNQTSNLLIHKCVKKFRDGQLQTETALVCVDTAVKKEFCDVLAIWAIEDGVPFNAVAGTGFKKVIKLAIENGDRYGGNLNLDHLLPHPTSISRKITKLREYHHQEIVDAIRNQDKIGAAITSDLYTDDYKKRSYLSATFSYIKNDLLYNRVLFVKNMNVESNTGIQIKRKMTEELAKYYISADEESITYVTDRGSNMISAFGSNIRINCIDHLLNNVLENVFTKCTQLAELNDLLTSCKELVAYFKRGALQSRLKTSLKAEAPTR
jgi:hypothetical protein